MTETPRVYMRERAPGTWWFRTYLGTDDAGKPRFRSETIKATETEARAHKLELEAAILRGEKPGLSGETLGGFCDEYLERLDKKGALEVSTLRGYRQCRNRITPKLNKMAIEEVTPALLESFEAKLLETLSPTTVLNTHRFLHLALEHAEKLELVVRNPASKVKPPKPERKQRRELSFDDLDLGFGDEPEGEVSTIPRSIVEDLISSFESAPADRPWMHSNPALAAIFFTAYATGLRRGELLALAWKDFDLEAGELRVSRAVYWPHGLAKPSLKAPKTTAGRRTITLSGATVAKLQAWRSKLSS